MFSTAGVLLVFATSFQKRRKWSDKLLSKAIVEAFLIKTLPPMFTVRPMIERALAESAPCCCEHPISADGLCCHLTFIAANDRNTCSGHDIPARLVADVLVKMVERTPTCNAVIAYQRTFLKTISREVDTHVREMDLQHNASSIAQHAVLSTPSGSKRRVDEAFRTTVRNVSYSYVYMLCR